MEGVEPTNNAAERSLSAGRMQPWEDVDAEIRKEFGFAPRTGPTTSLSPGLRHYGVVFRLERPEFSGRFASLATLPPVGLPRRRPTPL